MSGESEIVLEVDGQIMSGWTRVSVRHSLDSLCREFDFALSGEQTEVRNLCVRGAACKVYAQAPNGAKYDLIDGYIDGRTRGLNGDGETLSVSGRDKTLDIVDCAGAWTSSTWTSQKFSRIVRDLCEPFSLPVFIDFTLPDPTIDSFTLQQGETVFNAIERLARFVGVLPFALVNGSLTFVSVGQNRAAQSLEVGKNIVDVGITEDDSDRFSVYTGKGIRRGRGESWTLQDLQMVSTVRDSGIKRYRPMILIAESKTDKANLDKRVRWEAQVRAGKSTQYTVFVRDFFMFNSLGGIVNPWTVNDRVDLIVARWDLREDLVIAGIDFSFDNSGRSTQLTLRPASTYDPDPGEEVKL